MDPFSRFLTVLFGGIEIISGILILFNLSKVTNFLENYFETKKIKNDQDNSKLSSLQKMFKILFIQKNSYHHQPSSTRAILIFLSLSLIILGIIYLTIAFK